MPPSWISRGAISGEDLTRMSRTRLAVLVACLVGISAGVGAFTFRLCEGFFVPFR